MLELATFMMMRGSLARIVVLPLSKAAAHRAQLSRTSLQREKRPSVEAIQQSLEHLDSASACCSDPKDREAMLAVIEASFGSFDEFNGRVRRMLIEACGTPHASMSLMAEGSKGKRRAGSGKKLGSGKLGSGKLNHVDITSSRGEPRCSDLEPAADELLLEPTPDDSFTTSGSGSFTERAEQGAQQVAAATSTSLSVIDLVSSRDAAEAGAEAV